MGKDNSSKASERPSSAEESKPIPALFPGLPAETSQGPAFPEVPRPTVPPAPTKKRTKPPPPPRHTLPRAAKAPKPAPLVAQSSRPIREAATSVPDYQLKSGKGRRGTAPVPRRQGGEQATDRGGAKGNNQPPDSDEDDDESDTSDTSDDSDHPEPITQESINDEDDEPVDLENALRATPIVNSLYDVYDIHLGEILPFEHALEMCYAMAVDKHQQAFGAATRPEDAPRTFREAMSSASADHWIDATQAEMDAHETNGTWELVELPEGRKVIGSRWVFIIKRKADGTIDKYKASLFAQGYSQMPGVDYDQTFSPASADVSNAYLNGVMKDEYEVYMRQAEGYKVKGPNGKKCVCHLKKGIYELKQSRQLWNQKLAAELEQLGFTQIKSDPSIYVWETDGIRIILPVFVDDITIASASPEKIQWVKDTLGKVFKLKDLSPTSFLLGIKINYDRENRVLQLSQYPDNPVDMTGVPYMSGVGAAMYLAIAMRPDLIYAVAKLAQYNSNPGPEHWKALKHLFRYIKGTIDLKLTYRGGEEAQARKEETNAMLERRRRHREDESEDSSVHGLPIYRERADRGRLAEGGQQGKGGYPDTYSNADHAGCLDTCRSTSGFLIKMGSGAVSWSSKKQTTIADSSTEAEYEIGVEVKGPSPLMVDNQWALRVLNNPEHHGRMKHIDVKYHWVRDAVKQGKIEVHFLPTQDMIADIVTKPLPHPAIEQHHSLSTWS
ncbi:hypothetical protein NMY22_g9112 [Coprinellus aureogranulatus]|nr:hypothetical protein NMY22_g9112 [Coprinellus aureogranulatus]